MEMDRISELIKQIKHQEALFEIISFTNYPLHNPSEKSLKASDEHRKLLLSKIRNRFEKNKFELYELVEQEYKND